MKRSHSYQTFWRRWHMRVNIVMTALHQRFIYVTHCQNGAKFNIVDHAVTFTHSATANKLY